MALPIADFSADILIGYNPIQVQFTDQSTSFSGGILSWLWDFGDNDTSTQQSPTHIYNNPGYYEVSLTVTDLEGSATESKLDYIKVNLIAYTEKIMYILAYPILKTWDNAPPPDRLDLRIAIAQGSAKYLFFKDTQGVRPYVPVSDTDPFPGGFKRPQGPTLIYD